MKVHRNLLWLRAQAELIDQLMADKALSILVQARPAPEAIGIKRAHHRKLLERLEKLGFSPREIGKW
jgi:hypothetical protein